MCLKLEFLVLNHHNSNFDYYSSFIPKTSKNQDMKEMKDLMKQSDQRYSVRPTHGNCRKQSPDVFYKKRCSKKMRLWLRGFPVNFAKFLRAPFQQNTSERLLLNFKRICGDLKRLVISVGKKFQIKTCFNCKHKRYISSNN